MNSNGVVNRSQGLWTVMLLVCLTLFGSSSVLAMTVCFQEQAENVNDDESVNARDRWTEDIDAAVKLAKADQKDLLLLFTGSDWCPPCIRLEKEVLGEQDFQFEASQQFVLVKFDFLRNTPQDESIATRNREWAQNYGVDGYPTVIVVDRELRPYGITGYQAGGVENYLGMLEEFRQHRITRDEKLAEAEKATGLERARLLDEGIAGINEQIVEVYYPEIVDEIVKLDKEDELGLRTKWNAAKDSEMRKIVLTDILMVSRLEKPDRALTFIDEVMKQINFPTRQMLQIYQIKVNLARKLKDHDLLDKFLDEMIAMDGVEGETRERLIVKKVYALVGTDRRAEAIKLLDDSLASGDSLMHLWKAKGDLLDAVDDYQASVEAYDRAIQAAANAPDVLIEVVGAKADALFEMKQTEAAIQVLDNFADDTNNPSDLRSEAMLHKSMIMRDMGRRRPARLAENRAIEIAESSVERAEIQKMVQRLREKYGDE